MNSSFWWIIVAVSLLAGVLSLFVNIIWLVIICGAVAWIATIVLPSFYATPLTKVAPPATPKAMPALAKTQASTADVDADQIRMENADRIRIENEEWERAAQDVIRAENRRQDGMSYR